MSQWVSSACPPKKSDASAVASTLLALRILGIIGLFVVWAFLGYNVLQAYIYDRRFPTAPLSCDASLLDPMFYVTAVVVTVLFVGSVVMIVDASIVCCCPGQTKHGSAGTF